MSSRFNRVSINALHLTKDSSAMATPCRLSVTGLDKLKTTAKGRVVRGLDNTPTRLSTDFGGRGIDISVTVEILHKDVFDDINAEIAAACSSGATLSIAVTGDTGNYNLTVIPGDEPVQFAGEFWHGLIKVVTYNFVTT